MKITILMFYHLYLAVNGKPVGVDIKQTHKDGNHKTFFVKVFILFDLFYHYDFPIGRSYDDFFGVFIVVTDRAAEEVDDDAINDNCYCGKSVKRDSAIHVAV